MSTTMDAADALMSIENNLKAADRAQPVTVGDLVDVVSIVRRVLADLPGEISSINELERFIREIHGGRVPAGDGEV
jgi:hypothetical protein